MLKQVSDLDLRLLRVFLAVVEAGGISAAQTILNVSQSTISTQLGTLEVRLGFRLCARGRSGFRLTPKGEHLVQASRHLLSAIDSFCTTAQQVERTLSGTLNIGFIGHAAMCASGNLSKVIARFRERDQAVKLNLSVMTPSHLEEAVIKGDVDIGFGYFWHRVANLEYDLLYRERQLAYCGREHVLFSRSGTLDFPEVLEHDWVWRSYSLPEADDFAQHLATSGRVTAWADNMEATAVLIRSGRHLGFLPEHLAAPMEQQRLLASLNQERLRYDVQIHMITRPQHARSEVLDAFLTDVAAVRQELEAR